MRFESKAAILLALSALSRPARGGEPFSFDASQPKVAVWGRGDQLPRRYFSEPLPALFERTLVLDQFDPGDGELEWIFTGEQAGFTVRMGAAQVRLIERFYDSFGLAPVPARHPERIWLDESVPRPAALRRVTVILDHKLELAVALDGREVIRKPCLFDVRHHQLAFSGKCGRARGSMESPAESSAVVRVDPRKRHQTMLGFGGITTPAAYHQLSAAGKRRWWDLLRCYNLLLHREYPMGARLASDMSNWDRLDDAAPHYYGDNFPNGEVSDFEYLRTVRQIGGKVLFEFWDLPPWAKRADGNADPEAWARAVVRYCRISRDRAGSPPDIVGIQNERAQPPEVWQAMVLRLRAELDRAGFPQVKLHMQDSSSVAGGIRSALAFRASPPVWDALDFTASHMYDYQQFFHDPDGFDARLAEWARTAVGKPFLSTEISVNQAPFQVSSYRLALAMGQLYHKNLALADASALLYCWLLLNVEQPSYGWTRSLFVPDLAHGGVPAASSYQLRVFGAYSRRVRAGMVRVEAIPSQPGLLAVAFAGEGGEKTLVMLNRSQQPRRVGVEWEGRPFQSVETADPYHENAVDAGVSQEILVQPGALVTLSTAGRTSAIP